MAQSPQSPQPRPVAPASPPPSSASADAPHKTVLLSIDDALRIGSGESEAVWIAEAGVMRAVGTEMTTRSTLFPQLSANGAYIRTLRSQFGNIKIPAGPGGGTETLPFGQKNEYSLGLNFSQLIFDGQTLPRTKASESRRRSAEINADSARAEALLDLTGAYYDALLGERLVAIAEASLAQQDEILRQTTVAQQVGDKSEFELLQARVSRDNQLPQVLQSRNQRQVSYLRLKQLLNLPLTDELQLTSPLEELPARFAAPADLSTEARAPVRQAQEEVTANQSLLTAAKGERWPTLSLASNYNPVAYPSGLPTYGDFLTNWSVTLSVSVPILNGGRLAGDELTARGNLSTARAELQQTRKAAELDVETSRLNLANAEAILKSNEGTVDSARRGWEIAQLRYREGLGSQIELQNARLLFEQSEVNRAQALRDVQVARARLALIRDLPVTAGNGAGNATAQNGANGFGNGSGSNGIAAGSSQPAQTSQPQTGQPSTSPGTTGTTIPGVSPP